MSKAPDLKGSSFTLSVLHLSDHSIENCINFLSEKVAQAPAFFANAPIVVDVSQVEKDIDFSQLKQGINDAGLVPVGITGSKDRRSQTLAHDAGFAIMSRGKALTEPKPVQNGIKVIEHPVRSGQQIYAKDCDLVILNHVSAGAEVIADGSIHIHGSLRGRAIAGATGNKEARILCQDLQAELVSIAGNYWLSEQIAAEYWNNKVMLFLDNDTLHFKLINL
jgi:septum site-determining protein MinC